MKRIVLLFLFTVSIAAYGQKLGFGVRLGDPSGLTLKKYFSKNALEISVGRTYMFYGRGWYDHRFNDWYERQKYDYEDFQYMDYHSSVPIGVQVHYLFNNSINKIGDDAITGLNWYYGFGGQLRFQNYTYDFKYKIHGDNNWYYEKNKQVNNIDLGGDGVIGLEYTFDKAPLSIFLDITLFMEVVDDPFLFHFQSGLGCRYNF